MRPLRIERRGAVEQVADELERRILDGELPPGTPMRDSRLAPEHGLSRNTVREAIRGLVAGGLVRHLPHRGFVVRELSAEEVKDLYRAREAVELAVGRAPLVELRRQLPRLEDAAEHVAAAHLEGDWSSVFQAHRAFHVALVAAAGSPRLERFLAQLFGELRLAMAQVDRVRQPPEQSGPDHEALLEPIRSGDRRLLVRRIREHIRTGEKRVLLRLSEAGAVFPRSTA